MSVVARRAGRLADLRPPSAVDGPRVRLGLVWVAFLGVAVVAGGWWLAATLAAVASVAAAQVARTWRRGDQQVIVAVAVLGAGVLVLAAWAGALAVIGAAIAVVAASFAWEPAVAVAGRFDPGSRTSAFRTACVAIPIGLAGASVVWTRERGLTQAVVLVALAQVHDASNYLIGSGAKNAWEGPVAAAAGIGSVSLAVAAVLVPPFRGASPWILGALGATLAPAGPYVASALCGARKAVVPALRRIDVFLVLGPVWAVASRLLTTTS